MPCGGIGVIPSLESGLGLRAGGGAPMKGVSENEIGTGVMLLVKSTSVWA